MKTFLVLAITCALVRFSTLPLTAATGRLFERRFQFSDQGALEDVPVVDPPRRIAGYFKLKGTKDAHMFYFFFESRSKKNDDPVVLWMTGGPGCSSELAVFYENGPYNLEHNLTLSNNPWGWDLHANMIYVDQPVNTGFSWSDNAQDVVYGEKQVAADMLDFLGEFFNAHPELADREFYATGESYAGHYVPAVAYAVYEARELGTGPSINLKGVAIGNGYTNPGIQYGAYADYALENGLITQAVHDSIQWWYAGCRWGAQMCNSYKWSWLCGLTYQYCQYTTYERVQRAQPGINVFDIRKACEGPLCYDFSAAQAFLNSAHVHEALGVGDRRWELCNPAVDRQFRGDMMRDLSGKLVLLLEDAVRVMIYVGDKDLSCNWVGNKRWLDALDWEGAQGWGQAEEKPWFTKSGRQAGTLTRYSTLSFVKVFDSGHLVPMDQPEAALELITGFLGNKDIASGNQQV